MTAEDVLAAFAFAKDRPLQMTIVKPTGAVLVQDAPCFQPKDAAEFYKEPPKGAVIRLAPLGVAGYYTDFPVEKVAQDHNGNLTLSGPKGTATFKVGGK